MHAHFERWYGIGNNNKPCQSVVFFYQVIKANIGPLLYIFDSNSKTLRSITSFKLSSFRPDGFPYSTMATLPFWFSVVAGRPFFSVQMCFPKALSTHPPSNTRVCGEESSTLPSISRRRIRSPWSLHPSPREFKRWMVEAESGDQTKKNPLKKHTGYTVIWIYIVGIIKEILPQMAFIFNSGIWGFGRLHENT